MPKFTPGPWRITPPSVMNGVQIVVDYNYPLRSDTICSMPKKGKGRTANARLITKSPELHSLLTEFLCDQETMNEPYRNEALCEKARKLLSEIEG